MKKMPFSLPSLSPSLFFLLISPSIYKATAASPVNLASAGWLKRGRGARSSVAVSLSARLDKWPGGGPIDLS